MHRLPLVDISPLLDPSAGDDACARVGAQVDAACRDTGFLLVTGHGIDPALRDDLERLSREFFALPEDVKGEIAMSRGGTAWRGWFPVGAELTSGRPDRKEGVYFGAELSADDARVRAGTPLHGPNLFPVEPAGLRDVVLRWLEQVTAVGQALLGGIALGLGLERDWFARHLTADPTVLFRVFHYPPGDDASWGVGEHTDYGLLTLLAQDAHGGLQVLSGGEWIDVPADPYAFVVNIGDMLERMTRGGYRSNPHRVRNLSGADRLSFPLFLDPVVGRDGHPAAGVGLRRAAGRRRGAPLGRAERARVGGRLRRLPHRQGREGVPDAGRRAALTGFRQLASALCRAAYCPAVTPDRLTLPPQPESVPQVRRFVRDRLQSWGFSGAVDTATMLVSELATNAVLHARTEFTVELSRDGESLRVCVLDTSPALPRPRRYGTDSTTGRGLRLVETLSTCWGIERQDDGKTIWFEVPVDNGGREIGSWETEPDVDAEALLASFGDDDDAVVSARTSLAA